MANQTSTFFATRVPSAEQSFILREFKDGTTHFVVEAGAGCGKTTIILAGVEVAPEQNILVCAFSKIIEVELTSRIAHLAGKVKAKTLHALGLSCVKRFWPDVSVSFTSMRADDLAEKVCGAQAPDVIKRLVAKLHTKGREIAPHARVMGDLTDIAIRFECDPDESWTADGFGLDYVEEKALEAMELAATIKPARTGIDGSDMIFLPVRNRWLRPMFDMVVVDEAQDMTAAQLEIAQGVCKGRIVVVGDPRQAIFGFRGADSDSLNRLRAELKANVLPLKTTYRCGKSIVREANKWVEDFSAGSENPEGEVSFLPGQKLTATASAGDYILSRVNAPLVSIAMSLLRAGKRTRIAGRDVGKGLITLVRKLKARSVPELLERIAGWEEREINRLEARYKGKNPEALTARIDGVRDQAQMLTSVTDGAKNVDEVTTRIEALFTDDGLGAAGVITCSSVHRAKGLEAERVFIIASTLRTDSLEEQNICYVAVTRAKSSLVYVTGREAA